MTRANQSQWTLSVKDRQIWWHDQEYEWYYKVLYVGFEQLIALGAVPLILLIYFNYSIYLAFKLPQDIEIQASEEITRNSREKKLSKVLISIVTVFIFCQSTRIVWYLYYGVNFESIVNCPTEFPGTSGESPWTYVLALVYEFFLVLNSSVNTMVYFVVNGGFRYRILRCITAPFRRMANFLHNSSNQQFVITP